MKLPSANSELRRVSQQVLPDGENKTQTLIEATVDVSFFRYSFLNRGGDRVVVDYANFLAAQGHSVTFHTRLMRTVFTRHPAITVNMLPVCNEIGFLLYPLQNRLLHDVSIFDIIHCAPSLYLHHKDAIVYFAQANDVEYYSNPLVRFFIRLLYRWFFQTQIPTITVSSYLTETFNRQYGASNCHTVINGINLETFYPSPDSVLVREKAGRTVIFFMARGDHFRKGFDIAIKVLKTIDQTLYNKIELWVCGERFDTQLPFPVRQFGVVDDQRLRQILSSADIFLYPSRHEGFGLFPLEAMACGCVPVTTEAIPYAGFSDCLQVAPIGDIDSLKRLIVSLLLDRERLAELRQKSKLDVAQFDLQNSKKLFCHTLERLIEATSP